MWPSTWPPGHPAPLVYFRAEWVRHRRTGSPCATLRTRRIRDARPERVSPGLPSPWPRKKTASTRRVHPASSAPRARPTLFAPSCQEAPGRPPIFLHHQRADPAVAPCEAVYPPDAPSDGCRPPGPRPSAVREPRARPLPRHPRFFKKPSSFGVAVVPAFCRRDSPLPATIVAGARSPVGTTKTPPVFSFLLDHPDHLRLPAVIQLPETPPAPRRTAIPLPQRSVKWGSLFAGVAVLYLRPVPRPLSRTRPTCPALPPSYLPSCFGGPLHHPASPQLTGIESAKPGQKEKTEPQRKPNRSRPSLANRL